MGTTQRLLSGIGLVVAGALGAVVLIVAAELALRLIGVPSEDIRHDPFAGFSREVPQFVRSARPDGTRVIRLPGKNEEDDRPREPQREFLAKKAPGTFRIFVVGGSSAAGVPYGTGHAFSATLAKRLSVDAPGVRWEVVNAARSGYASRRVLTLVREIATYEPDLLIVYSGHNEFAERRFYAHLLDMNPRRFRLYEWVVSTRLYALFAEVPFWPAPPGQDAPQIEMNDDRRGLEMFAVLSERAAGRGYPTEREIEYGEMLFRRNLEEMVLTMRTVGADAMLLTVSQNLSDWPPGASSHGKSLSPTVAVQWQRFVDEGDRLADENEDCRGALAAYRKALAIDDTYAELHYRIARCQRLQGQLEEARLHYRRASDLDRVPLGAPSRFNDIVREVAHEYGSHFVDVDAVLERESADRLLGDDLFADFVHPNLRAHQRIGAAIAEGMRGAGIGLPAQSWNRRYSDPDPKSILAAEPDLLRREHLVRGFSCFLARRRDCAREEIQAVLDTNPDDQAAARLNALLSAPDR